jgi:hypothetical protein
MSYNHSNNANAQNQIATSDPSSVPVLDPAMITELRQLVATYHDVDKTLRHLRNTMLEQRRIKQNLSERICSIMNKQGLSDIRYADSMLRYTTQKYQRAPTKSTIKSRLNDLFEEVDKRTEAMQIVFAPMSVEERVCIRKVRVR